LTKHHLAPLERSGISTEAHRLDGARDLRPRLLRAVREDYAKKGPRDTERSGSDALPMHIQYTSKR